MARKRKPTEHPTVFVARFKCDVDVLIPITIKQNEHPDAALRRAKHMFMEETPIEQAIEDGTALVKLAPGGVRLIGVSPGEAS
jgi:hypothetical protein